MNLYTKLFISLIGIAVQFGIVVLAYKFWQWDMPYATLFIISLYCAELVQIRQILKESLYENRRQD